MIPTLAVDLGSKAMGISSHFATSGASDNDGESCKHTAFGPLTKPAGRCEVAPVTI